MILGARTMSTKESIELEIEQCQEFLYISKYEISMQRLVPELANMVVDALCSIEGVSPLDVVRRVAAYDSMALKTAYDEWNDRDDEPLGDLDEHPF